MILVETEILEAGDILEEGSDRFSLFEYLYPTGKDMKYIFIWKSNRKV